MTVWPHKDGRNVYIHIFNTVISSLDFSRFVVCTNLEKNEICVPAKFKCDNGTLKCFCNVAVSSKLS